ncbi:hypothetical protein VA596_25295 [Amycolatopsis sp., V23-08]|uniref:Uncharacterized protein n=1 Tax=Amycolatopsis heterodermiae TaxID=3110235 RepID=A0ABU5R9F0_9PSEU|nr:hypothetical protein [Amycolatopsis sp., V23-08]MEA5362873.1 hypothetical protein [Amycolatopsis sp., V23-08]
MSSEDDRETRSQLQVLATFVRAELAAAGLPVTPEDHPPGTAGAVVGIDPTELDGVEVGWRTHAILLDAAQDAWADDPLAEGAEYAAFSRQGTAIAEAMKDALRRILTAAGFAVADSGNDYAPHGLLVTGRPEVSPWEARRSAALHRRQEKMIAVWNNRG